MLFEAFYTPCQRLTKTRKPDGEGGHVTTWDDGEGFEAAVVLDTSTEARVAESAGLSRSYRVTAPIGTGLGFHEAFKRLSDGQVFRVITEAADVTTPKVASFKFEVVRAEAWELPDE